jgi:hypothetical protein
MGDALSDTCAEPEQYGLQQLTRIFDGGVEQALVEPRQAAWQPLFDPGGGGQIP